MVSPAIAVRQQAPAPSFQTRVLLLPAKADRSSVVWVPHNELRKMYGTETFGSAQTLLTLEDFKPEEWNLRA